MCGLFSDVSSTPPSTYHPDQIDINFNFFQLSSIVLDKQFLNPNRIATFFSPLPSLRLVLS